MSELFNLGLRFALFLFGLFVFFKFSAIFLKYGVQITKLVLALIIGGNLANYHTLVDKGDVWNILAWTALFFIAFSILFILPRTKCAITFMCNLGVLAIVIYGLILTQLPNVISTFVVTKTVNIIACVLCYIFSFILMIKQISFKLFHDVKKKAFRIIDRIISSLFYSLAILIVFTIFVFSKPSFDSELLFFLIWAAVYAAVFLADIFVFDNILMAAEMNYVNAEDSYQALSGFANIFDVAGLTKDPDTYTLQKEYNPYSGEYELNYKENDRLVRRKEKQREKELARERQKREEEYAEHRRNKR